MQVGDLVIKDYTGWPEGDQWGSGIVVELDSGSSDYIAVYWSKIGLSWEPPDELVSINECR